MLLVMITGAEIKMRTNPFQVLTCYLCSGTDLDANHLLSPLADEIKEGQWLGVSVRSQGPGRKAIVCAHR